MLRRLRPPLLLCVATAAFSRPSVAEWSGAITFGLLTHSLRVFLRRRRRRRRQCLVTMDGSWRWSCGGVGREGPAPLHPPPHFGGGGIAASCDSSTDRPRRSMRPLHASLLPFLPSPRGLFRDYTRHSFFRHRDPRASERELHCTLPHIPWNNKRGARAAAALLFVLSSKWAACAMCVDVHTLSRPAPKVGRSRLSSRRSGEGWSMERGSFFGLAVCAISPPTSCLFFDSWRRSFVFVESGSGRRRRRFRFRGEQRIIRDHELSQVASPAAGLIKFSGGGAGWGVESTVRFVSVELCYNRPISALALCLHR